MGPRRLVLAPSAAVLVAPAAARVPTQPAGDQPARDSP
jgi:hypothetical protein